MGNKGEIVKMLFTTGLATLITFLLIAGLNCSSITEWNNGSMFFNAGRFWATVDSLSLWIPICISLTLIIIAIFIEKKDN